MPDTLQHTRAVMRGERDAIARLYREWFDRFYAWARAATGRDEAFCLDVVQDSFLKLLRAMKPIDSQPVLAAYLHRVVLSCAIDALRREQRRARHERRHGALNPPGEPAQGAHDPAERAERLQRLRAELARADAATAAMLRARHAGGATLSAIGRVLGLAPGAVDGRISRAHARLRAGVTGAEDSHE